MMTAENIFKMADRLVTGMKAAGHQPYEVLSILVMAIQISFRHMHVEARDRDEMVKAFDAMCARSREVLVEDLDKTIDGNASKTVQ